MDNLKEFIILERLNIIILLTFVVPVIYLFIYFIFSSCNFFFIFSLKKIFTRTNYGEELQGLNMKKNIYGLIFFEIYKN